MVDLLKDLGVSVTTCYGYWRPTLGDVLHVNNRTSNMTNETKIIVLVLLVLATRRKYGVDWGLPGSVMESKASYSTMVL